MEIPSPVGKLNVRMLIVDFFGSLIPGIIFTGISSIIILLVLFSSIEIIYLIFPINNNLEFNLFSFTNNISAIVSSFRFELIIFFLFLSYVLGHIFYRQDLKVPDKLSFSRIRSEMNDKQLKEWVAKNESEVEYPYTNLQGYLESRGLKHLSQMVPWSRNDKKDKNKEHIKRTKYFIGILKIRLSYYCPDKCGTLIRNEAHIRLSSTTWYLSCKIRKICIISILFPIVSLILSIVKNQILLFPQNLNYFIPIFIIFIMYILIIRIIKTIEKFLHYQRVREIVHVLETAYNLFRERIDLMSDIYPEYSKSIAVIKK